jgi:hypothetical protein
MLFPICQFLPLENNLQAGLKTLDSLCYIGSLATDILYASFCTLTNMQLTLYITLVCRSYMLWPGFIRLAAA